MLLKTGFIPIFLSVVIYGIIHSLLASLQVKEQANRYFGENSRKYYRILFIISAIVTFLPILLMMVILPDTMFYTFPFPYAWLTISIQITGVIGACYSLLQTNIWHFVGIHQVRHPESEEYEKLMTKGPYRFVRHPIYFFSLLFLWLMPVMSWNILAFNLSATLYMTIGSMVEERKLKDAFGQSYIDYQKNTPMLLPLPKRKK